ncbi:hypothetical protein ACFQZ4_46965 [Catellatospora coxensis]
MLHEREFAALFRVIQTAKTGCSLRGGAVGPGRLYRVSLAIDGDARPHIAFVSEASDHLMYGFRNSSWQFEEVPTEAGLFAGSVRFPAMKLYRGDLEVEDVFKWRPHFCYQAGLALKHLAKQPRRDNPAAGAVWKKHFEEVDPVQVTEKGWYATLDFDRAQDNTMRIAYFDELPGAAKRQLRLATMTQSFEPGVPNTWTVDVIDGGDVLGSSLRWRARSAVEEPSPTSNATPASSRSACSGRSRSRQPSRS